MKRYASAALGLLLLSAACTDPQAGAARAAKSGMAALKARAAQRTPVPAAELRRLIPGHYLDERPYPCDAGPTLIQNNGTFIIASGWGSTEGSYTIADGAIVLDGYRSNTGGDPRVRFTLKFARDGNGTIHYRDLDERERELKLGEIDANTLSISCGSPAP
ncbi:MAG: hypothetical protein V4574_15530 [Pseudomonadota bacterium]